MSKKKILILGLGNDILSDDRIGLQLVSDLEKEAGATDVCFRLASSGGFEIVELIRGFDKAVLIDAIKTKNGSPGDVYHFTRGNFRETLHLSGLHDINFITAYELAGRLSPSDLTHDLHIIAVEILEDMVFSEEMTPVLRLRYEEIRKNVKEIIRSILIDEVQ